MQNGQASLMLYIDVEQSMPEVCPILASMLSQWMLCDTCKGVILVELPVLFYLNFELA